ncbi:unnamed protein product [Victoria cruziana]
MTSSALSGSLHQPRHTARLCLQLHLRQAAAPVRLATHARHGSHPFPLLSYEAGAATVAGHAMENFKHQMYAGMDFQHTVGSNEAAGGHKVDSQGGGGGQRHGVNEGRKQEGEDEEG